MTQGSCLCGALRYEVQGPFNMMLNCHCSMCRKHHGSAFATFVGAPLAGFRWISGEQRMRTYPSSEQGKRVFCGGCGSVGPTLAPEMGLVILPAGNLQGELGLKPQGHMFVGSKAPWYEISDDLPQYEEYPPEFGAKGLARPTVKAKPGVIQGSCLCGEVAYEIEGQPTRMTNCYCSRCRRARSAAHATNFICKIERLRWVRGEQQVVTYKVPEAQFFTVAFCNRCGGETPYIAQARGFVVIPGGSLDTDPHLSLTNHIFVDSKASWVDVTERAAPRFPGQMPLS